MKWTVFIMVSFLPFVSTAQRVHINLFGGFANYQGDLQDKPFTLSQSNGAFGAGLTYDLSRHLSVRGGFMYGVVSADDKNNKPSLQLRNLNFKSGIFEGNLLVQYHLFDLNIHKFTPYVFGGIGVFHYNPYSYDSVGNKILLRSLSTEGQGLTAYPERKPYQLTQVALPFGGGIKLRVAENMVLGYELGLRKLFTDYLDDVSTTYVDRDLLAAEKGPKAVEMSYRGGEIKDGNPVYPAEGSQRGGARYKDWYYFHGITLSIGINGARQNNRSGVGCPPVH